MEKSRTWRPLLRRTILVATGLALIGVAALLLSGSAAESRAPHPFLSSLSVSLAGAPGGEASPSCGTARDSRGDFYVSDPAGSAVDVFGPKGDRLGAIRGVARPCDLAVNPKGDVYVSESGRGEVVKYPPEEYPLRGHAAYGAPVTVDASGRARGIAVDSYDGRLYVAEGDRVSTYDPNGTLGEDEVQRVYPYFVSGGVFRLFFEGKQTRWLPYNATSAEIEAALAALPTIGRGNVSVGKGPNGRGDHLVIFSGALGSRDVPMLRADNSRLRGGRIRNVYIREYTKGFDGRIGEGVLRGATGVAAHIYAGVERTPPRIAAARRPGWESRFASFGAASGSNTYVSHEIPAFRGLTHYVFVAERSGADRIVAFTGNDVRKLRPQPPIDGSGTPAGSIGFGRSGAVLAIDPGNGHLFVYDARHAVMDELEADGAYVSQIARGSFAQEAPTGVAVERSGGSGEGTVYVTVAGAAGAKALAFGRLPQPRREAVVHLKPAIGSACGLTTDSYGDVYVAFGAAIEVFDPNGAEITRISVPRHPCDIAVDSTGVLYASVLGRLTEGDEEVLLYRPSSFPLTSSTTYSGPKSLLVNEGPPRLAIDPRDDRVFVRTHELGLSEYRSAAEGSGLITEEFASGKATGIEAIDGSLDVCAKSGDFYVVGKAPAGDAAGGWRVYVLNHAGTESLTTITGRGSPRGAFTETISSIAVDQSNCHVLVKGYGRNVEEYEASGAFVTEFGAPDVTMGVDNGAHSPNRGDVYAESASGLTRFGPLSYEPR